MAEAAEVTLDEVADTLAALRDEVRRLREEVRRERREELPRLQDLAGELGIGRSTLYAKLDRRGIPVRDSHGFPKEGGDKSAAHVSRTEWEAAEQLDTRTVRRRAGFYD
jgi:hypothetical protein